MVLTPKAKVGKINFFLSKVTPWQTNAVAIETTSAAVTAMSAKVTAAQDALAAQIAARSAAETATLTLHNAVSDMMVAGMDIVKDIRAKAATGGQAVYDLAQIP